MACWYPSNYAEAFYPGLRLLRLAKEEQERLAAQPSSPHQAAIAEPAPKRRRTIKKTEDA